MPLIVFASVDVGGVICCSVLCTPGLELGPGPAPDFFAYIYSSVSHVPLSNTLAQMLRIVHRVGFFLFFDLYDNLNICIHTHSVALK